MKKLSKKKISIIFVVIAIIIIILSIVIGIFSNSKLKLNEFEKVAVYNYLEDNFLDYDLLQNLTKESENEVIVENNKMYYAIERYLNKNNTNKIEKNTLREYYNNIFGEELKSDIEAIDVFSNKYIYNFEDNTINKVENNDDVKTQDLHKLEISDITVKDNNYIVNLNVIAYDNDSNLDTQTKNENKIGAAQMTLQVKDGKYIIVSYKQNI